MDIFDYGFFILLSIFLALAFSKIGEKLREKRRGGRKFDFEREFRRRLSEWREKRRREIKDET